MTDDDFEGLIWFHLLDYNLTDVKYIAVDFDSEIVLSYKDMLTITESAIMPTKFLWETENDTFRVRTDIYINQKKNNQFIAPAPDNYSTVVIKLGSTEE